VGESDSLCVVRDEKGIALRDFCADCDGLPPCGQRKLEPKGVLYLAGDPASHVFTVVEGYLKESRTTEDGRILGIRIVIAGDLVGTEALAASDYQCTVEALTPSRVCAVSLDEVHRAMLERPEQGVAVATALSQEMRGLRDSMLLLSSMSAEERVRTALERLLGDAPVGAWIRLPLSRQELGDLLGLALATVSRTVRALERDGCYEVSGRRIRRV
jgi:CRP/FNR family transcriptional regulator